MFEWDIAVSMLSAYDADGFLGVQINAEGEQDSGVHPYPLHHMGGFMYRPLDPVIDTSGEPDPAKSAQILYAMEGGQAHAFCLEDPRSVAKLPALKKGEAAMYGAQGNFFRTHADGALSLVTSDDGTGTATGNAIFLRVRPTGFERVAPWGTERWDYTGYHLRCAGGARIDAGFLGGMPTPLDALTSYLKLEAATITLKCSVLKIGPPGPAQSVALMPALSAMFAAIATQLSLMQTAIAALAATSTNPAAGAAAVAATTNLQSLIGGAPALIEAMSSKSLQGG